ncbi:hypothetical protein ABNF97_03385 [Plantactinospora sp. B6F1]|uniref:hypothetical protein n=1 Tax=Plantactinospora sp. B6F1 TaxID=3158971 RepID=UPI0032D9125B
MTEPTGRRFYRLRTPSETGQSTAVSVRVDPDRPDPYPVYLAVGAGRRRMYLTPDEAWALWRCLSEAVATLGDPPDNIRTTIRPARR